MFDRRPGGIALPSAPILDSSELGYATIKSSLERKHQEAVYLSREHRHATAIKVSRYLSDGALHDVGGLAAVGDERLSLLAGATPDSVRSGWDV